MGCQIPSKSGAITAGTLAILNFLQNSTTASGATVTATIPGVRNNANYRTQIGFVIGNAEAFATYIEFTILDTNGNSIGSPKAYYLDPGLFAELEVPITDIANQTFDVASVRVRVIGGGAVTAYAKVIDKMSGDAVYISADQANPATGTTLSTPFHTLMRRFGAVR